MYFFVCKVGLVLIHKMARHLIMPSEEMQIFFGRAIKYLFTACLSDNYLFHEKSISKYLF